MVANGLLTPEQLPRFYADLHDPDFISAICVIHSRFSTNTFPTWELAQPFRFIAHNGEINTVQGNRNWMQSRRSLLQSARLGGNLERLHPIIVPGKSDSAQFDNMLELLVLGGRSLPHAMMMMIPEAWQHDEAMEDYKRAFYEYHSLLMEPWDGPASICFTDGVLVGALLDRNGLRPSRYCVTHDDRVIMASETGVLPIEPELIKEKGRLQPGKMFIVDMEQGRIISDDELKRDICSQKPYSEWLNKYKIRLEEIDEPRVAFTHLSESSVLKYQKAFGYSTEDIETILKPMALDGKEPIGSMGTDAPLAVLSDQPQHLSSYFKQLFAQVTNPPIDPLRENHVMSLATCIGREQNVFMDHLPSIDEATEIMGGHVAAEDADVGRAFPALVDLAEYRVVAGHVSSI